MMQKHIKVYREYFKIGDQDPTPNCEVCNRQGNDIHHITSRGLKTFEYLHKDYNDINHILNLIALCRDCHNLAHAGTYTKNHLYKIHRNRILQWKG